MLLLSVLEVPAVWWREPMDTASFEQLGHLHSVDGMRAPMALPGKDVCAFPRMRTSCVEIAYLSHLTDSECNVEWFHIRPSEHLA